MMAAFGFQKIKQTLKPCVHEKSLQCKSRKRTAITISNVVIQPSEILFPATLHPVLLKLHVTKALVSTHQALPFILISKAPSCAMENQKPIRKAITMPMMPRSENSEKQKWANCTA